MKKSSSRARVVDFQDSVCLSDCGRYSEWVNSVSIGLCALGVCVCVCVCECVCVCVRMCVLSLSCFLFNRRMRPK